MGESLNDIAGSLASEMHDAGKKRNAKKKKIVKKAKSKIKKARKTRAKRTRKSTSGESLADFL